MPHLMNCAHSPDGWCLDCVKVLSDRFERFREERVAQQKDSQTLTCVYCGHVYPPGTPASNHELLSKHVLECPEPPAAALRTENQSLILQKSKVEAELVALNDAKEFAYAICNLSNRMALRLGAERDEARKEVTRLKAGDFTEEEFQNLCHNKEKSVSPEDFCRGCEEYQRKLFGASLAQEYRLALEKILEAWDGGGGFSLVQACEEAMKWKPA